MNVREPQPGEILGGNYIIERELGRGGFGVVFKAKHVEIERAVAIKVMLATYAKKDPTAKERFRREATIAASLNYPNSLRVFDYGETDEGVFYIVMEFIQGQDLTKLLQSGSLPPRRAWHIIQQVLWALSEAHARGIVHRDIKPDNIMLVPLVYDPDFVKVMDFGIAKMVDSDEQITKAGMTLGTPRFMPIEQLKGHRLTPATDLYAVGLVLYEMVVGAPAFTGPSAVDTALAVMTGPSVKVPEDAPIPAGLRAIIERAAAKEPEDRYQSAKAFLEALDALNTSLFLERAKPPAPPAARISGVHPVVTFGTTGTAGTTSSASSAARDDGEIQETIQIDLREIAAARPPTRAAEATSLTEVQPSRESAPVVDRRAETTSFATMTMETAAQKGAAPTHAPAAHAPANAFQGASMAGAPAILVILQVASLVLLIVLLALRLV